MTPGVCPLHKSKTWEQKKRLSSKFFVTLLKELLTEAKTERTKVRCFILAAQKRNDAETPPEAFYYLSLSRGAWHKQDKCPIDILSRSQNIITPHTCFLWHWRGRDPLSMGTGTYYNSRGVLYSNKRYGKQRYQLLDRNEPTATKQVSRASLGNTNRLCSMTCGSDKIGGKYII